MRTSQTPKFKPLACPGKVQIRILSPVFPLGVSGVFRYPMYNFRIMFSGVLFTHFTKFFKQFLITTQYINIKLILKFSKKCEVSGSQSILRRIKVFWDIMLCLLANTYRSFEGMVTTYQSRRRNIPKDIYSQIS